MGPEEVLTQLTIARAPSPTVKTRPSSHRPEATPASASLFDYLGGMTGSTRAEGCCASWRIVLLAVTKVCANRISSPVLRLRSKRVKLLLEISRRSEWPRRKTL